MNQQHTVDSALKPTIRALQQLSPQSQETIASLVRQLAGREGITVAIAQAPFLLEQGDYFPSVDHLVPPDVTFENHCYYINLMREVAGLEKLLFQ